MNSFIFDLQRFGTQLIPASESFMSDGVTYKAVDGEVALNLDDNNKVSGIASGKVQAVVTGAENSPAVTFDATDSAFNFTATSDGNVISMTPFPIEFISGEFTYKGNRLDITAGSDLAIVSQRGNFILRNENHFESDSAYIFTSTSLTSNSEHVDSLFSLTNGTETRTLKLEQLGTVINHFDQRGVTLVEGSSEVLKIGDYTLTATANNGDAGLNFDLDEKGMTFVPNTGDGTLTVDLSRSGKTIFGGVLECTKGSIIFGYDHAVTFEEGTSFNFTTPNNTVLTVTVNGEATTNIALTDNGITFTPGSSDGGLNLSLSKKGKQVFEGSLNITDGTITFDTTEKKFSFTDGTKIALGIFGLELEIEVVGDTTIGEGSGANLGIAVDENGNLIFTPDENGGSLNIALKRVSTTPLQNVAEAVTYDDEAFFENNVTVTGSIMFNPEKSLLTLKDGTEVSFSLNDNKYTLTATAQGDAASQISLTEEGISITPQQDDGKLKLTLGSALGSTSVDIEVLSGGFVFGENGALNVGEGTELQVTFSKNYSVKFKTTDKAGGNLSLGTDGLTFTPNEGDGHLELSVTRGDETRNASLEMTGSLTYKLDGSISLAKDTVLKNVFEDGNILTITALTDASGSVLFHPQNGITITPNEPRALNVLFSGGGGKVEVFDITSIDGSVTYKGGVLTASDGTEVFFTNYYMESEMKLRTDGGSSSLEITEDSTSYIANEGATFVLDYLDGDTLEISGGKFIDDYEHAIITAGATFKTNDDEDYFYLETAGDYTLNGMKVTTTSAMTPVMLSDYKTITVNGISYTPLDENVTLTIDGDVATVSDGKVSMQMDGFDKVANFDTTDGSISYDSTTSKFTIAKDTKSYIGEGAFPDQFVAQGDFDITLKDNGDGTFTFTTDDTAPFAIERNGNIIMSTTAKLDGSIIIDPTNNEISLPKDTTITLTPKNGKVLQITALDDAGGQLTLAQGGIRFAPNAGDGALEFNFVDSGRTVQLDVTGAFTYKGLGELSLENGTVANFEWEDGTKLKLTSSGSTGSIGIDFDKGIKITSNDENLSMQLTTANGYSTEVSSLKGSLYYKEGTVTIEEGSNLTATATLGGQPINVTLEAIDGDGKLEFGKKGMTYSAGTGKLKVTFSPVGLDAESTFIVNAGSVIIDSAIFTITEGSDIATDLQDFMPALNFKTSEAGTYTINRQKITTSAEGLDLKATDDYMTFVTSDDNKVTYDGMTFAGNGNVSLKPDNVALGAGVEATGFGEGKSFMLAEAGNVTVDQKVFEADPLKNKLDEDVPLNVSVEGAEDGFIFSREITRESEDSFNDPDYTNVGKIFREEFHAANDDSYQIRTDPIGLQEVIGISADTTITGGATLGGEPSYNYFDITTETNGKFTIGEKVYVISEDSTVGTKLTAYFGEDGQSYAIGVKDLNGTISGDFTAHEVSINGSASAVQADNDTLISIAADDSGFKIFGLDDGEILKVSAKDTYIVNNTTINANAKDYIIGLDDAAGLYAMNNDTLVTGTESDDTIINYGTNVTINALGGNDSVANYVTKNVTISGGDGNDTITNFLGDSVLIDAGAGSNQIKLSGKNEVILLKGQTTVEGFNTGFGDGSDTIYIKSENDPAGVEFLDDGLTFGNDTASLTLSDVTTTAKVNLFHENRDVLNKGVFIAAGDWYKVEDSDLTLDAGEEVYFVGTAADPSAGVDFSDISSDLNVTLNTAYIDSEDYVEDTPFWVNGVYSIKGGAGNTTITGSAEDDTIITGSGATTIKASEGDDLISLTGGAALIQYAAGDGNDTIYGFNSNATLSPDSAYTTLVSGNDLIVNVGESKITLKDAANLPYPNIASSDGIVHLAEIILKRTALGYPAMAARVFNPTGNYGDEPTNYSAKKDWTITSADDLELHAVHYTPENSNDKWVVLIHGYGNNHTAMYTYAESYLANGYNVLMIDQRAAGESEGTWLTMGAAESADVALWTQKIACEYSNAKITLHGVSMGAATAMLAAARSDTKNVTSIVEDCGYSNVMETFTTIVTNSPELGIPPEVVPALNPYAASLTGYYLSEAAPIDSISSVKMPSLFISGDADTVAPVSMLDELYKDSGAEVKEKFIVEGAKHALAVFDDSIGYNNAVFRFVAEADGEGWDTTNTADNISLRGTKYNDTLANSGENVTIDSGDGNDSISNTADNVSINAGAGNDTVYNHADNITIDGGAGDDSISNNSDNVVFVYSGGNDTISGFKEDSVLSLDSAYSTQQSGDDAIVNVGDYKIVLKGASTLDNMDILNTGVTINNVNSDSLISGTKINDSISNYGTNVTIQALGGDDTIFNGNEYSIIDAGAGNDSISNYSPQGVLLSDNVSINGGAGNDTIRNEHAYNVTINAGSGNDKIIVVTGDHTTIDGGEGNDTILGEALSDDKDWAMGGYANINGGDGDDYIDPGFSDSASIMGGEGNDTIINEGDDTTINGGAGDDVISLHGASLESDVIKYEAGDGNDSIFGFNETSKLSITSGTAYSTTESGDDIIVNVGSNAITIAGGKSLSMLNIINYEVPALNIDNTDNNTLITGTELADTIKNSGSNVTISGRAGDDSITSSGTNVSIHGGAGSDSIVNSGKNSTVLGEYGDDKLSNTADNVLLDGSYGNDTITNSGDNVTLSGGAGYNYTSNTGDNVMFNFGGGLDTIYGFNETSSLSVSSADYDTLYGGKDILVSVGNDVALLKNAFLTNDSININGTPIEVDDKVIYLMPSGDEVLIGRSNVSIVSSDGDDRISLKSGASNDVIKYEAGDGNDTIWGFNETSQLSISGDYSSIKVGDDVIVSVGDDSITLVDASSVIYGKFVLTKTGAVTVDGKVFELTKNVPSGVTIKSTDDGFTVGITKDDGKIFTDEFIAQGDDSYTVQIDNKGLQTISGIDTGTEITSSATEDGKEAENQIYIVTEDAGSYTFNDMNFTTRKANAVIRLRPYAMAFDAADGIVYDGKTFSGSGNVTVSTETFALGAGVVANGFEDESFILMQKGTTTVDGRTFELTENISNGIMISGDENGYTFSHAITAKEANLNGLSSDYVGKVFSEKVLVEGDETYSLQAYSLGFGKVSGISNGATILGDNVSIDGSLDSEFGRQYFYVDTDTEGDFTIGEKTYSISGDSNVEIEELFLPTKSFADGFASLDGTVSGDFTGDELYVNGSQKPILINGDNAIKIVGSSNGTKLLDVSDGASLASLGGVKEVHTDEEGAFTFGATENDSIVITVQGDDNVTFELDAKENIKNIADVEGSLIFSETSNKVMINGIGGTFAGEFSSIGAHDDLLYVHDVADGSRFMTGDADKIWLQMRGETFTLNGNELTLTADSDGIWLRDKEIVGLEEGASLQVSKGGTYTVNETKLKARAGNVIIGLEDDAYIYDADNPLITRKTADAEIINHFKPENYTIASDAADITLSGGDLAIVKDTSAPVNITAGDDTIVSQGENVNVTLTGDYTRLFPLGGKMTVEGYDESTRAGFNTTKTNIFNAVEDGYIDFNNGNLKFGSAQVDIGQSSALMNFYNRFGKQQKVGYASSNDSLDVSGKTEDLLLVAKENSTIIGGNGNDTILANEGSFIDGGAGSNLVSMSSDGGNSNIVLHENATVEGFHTGWGDGSDTLYINVASDPAVDFKKNGLTFYDGGDILNLHNLNETAKVNLYYEERNRLRRGVFIAKNDWYTVEESDLVDNSGAGVDTELGIYFVGTSATHNHGIDFSGVTKDLNITLNTDYESKTAEFWVNNIHSIKGGAGNTTIIGSDKSDTILAGTGEQSIYGGAGHDKIFGNTSANKNVATFYYTAGDGRDSIENFDFTDNAQDVTADKVKLDDNSGVSEVFLRGDDVMLKVNDADGFLMLEGAQGKSFRLNDDLIAKVDTTAEFDGFTNCYVGIGTKATLTVGRGLGNVEVWLSDDSLEYHGTMYDGNFKVLDASQSDGSNILAGNELNNSILGGAGNDSLWGGYTSSNDTLIGGTGQNNFFYLQGNGRDVIQNAQNGDNVILDDIALDQIADANITASGVVLNFTDGGSLIVNSTADVTYQLADGSKYAVNRQTQDWVTR